ncbi:unnamed protein product, partial [marine sediment metagenome]
DTGVCIDNKNSVHVRVIGKLDIGNEFVFGDVVWGDPSMIDFAGQTDVVRVKKSGIYSVKAFVTIGTDSLPLTDLASYLSITSSTNNNHKQDILLLPNPIVTNEYTQEVTWVGPLNGGSIINGTWFGNGDPNSKIIPDVTGGGVVDFYKSGFAVRYLFEQ